MQGGCFVFSWGSVNVHRVFGCAVRPKKSEGGLMHHGVCV